MKFIFKMVARVRKIWLRSRVDAYARALHSIESQRQNDFYAERILHSGLARTLSRLRRYEKTEL